ncbi:hypothetical protein BDP27DRAFT_1427106 [Rhodocollybia butyracea]|uniref:WIF domain-containing protein n=1 Tax=Rhodocollybia butyracea TaxID=206335 RepID=A0A9P5PHD7_9AGAR|nr:hypothetical protein BDP27DRAFT_1427106 [Rhodocollybia butyracea]
MVQVLLANFGDSYDFSANFVSPDRDMMHPNGKYIDSHWTPADEKSEDNTSVPLSNSDTTSTSVPSATANGSGPTPHESEQLTTLIELLDKQLHLTGIEDSVEIHLSASQKSASLTIEVDNHAFCKDALIVALLKSDQARKATIRTMWAA